jgi:hypothetical protein
MRDISQRLANERSASPDERTSGGAPSTDNLRVALKRLARGP